ncbi:MAG TPA: tetratricopeptide repeat protein [Candidatus Acidoferrum sp.]|nr:tetratricopeptide repeat protein [Candidatus Acidoferrum sp.]
MSANSAAKYSLVFASLCLSIVAMADAQGTTNKPIEEALAGKVEAARATRDETQLNLLKAEFEKRIAGSSCEARCYYESGLVQLYLADAYELRKEKKAAAAATDRGIEVAQHSLRLDEKSADTHALLGDLYAHRITYGAAMFTGPKYGPKISEEIAKGMALDDKNPRIWATQGRKFLMAPKMFGGDVGKAIESFKKSLAQDGSQAETWSWLARAYKKQGDSTNAKEAVQKALQLEPQDPIVKAAASDIGH